MSVISFGESEEVWGASRRFVYNMLEFFIESAGQKEYLLEFKKSYDHGYNHVALESITFEELVEFRDLTAKYLASGAYESSEYNEEMNEWARANLAKLVEMIDELIARRRPI